MKRTEKEETKKVFTTVYVAIDGTEFRNQNDCEKYETSLECVLTARLNDITIRNTNLCTAFLEGSDDCDAKIVRPRNSEDINAINQLICLIRGTSPDNIDEHYVVKDASIGECIVLCYSCVHDYIWFHTEKEIREHWDRMFAKDN